MVTYGYFGSNGGCVIDFDPGAGTTNRSPATAAEWFIAKYTQAGALVWVKSLTGSNGYSRSITIDSTGNIVIAGNFPVATVDFDPGAGTVNLPWSAFAVSAFMAKYDSSGDYLWGYSFNQVGGTTFAAGQVITDSSSNIYMAFYENGSTVSVDLDPGAGTQNFTPVNNGSHLVLAKYDSSGNYVAHAVINAGSATTGVIVDMNNGRPLITKDASDNLYLGGAFTGTVDFDAGAGTYSRTSTGAGAANSAFVMSYSSSLAFRWASVANGGTGTGFGPYSYSQSLDYDPLVGTGLILAHTIVSKNNATPTAKIDFDPGAGTTLVNTPAVSYGPVL